MSFAVPAGARLVAELGCGTTFEVAHVEFGRRACVAKRMAPRAGGIEAARQALARERAALERLRHRAVPEFIGAGEDDSGPWLVQSLVPGASLRDLVVAFGHATVRGAAGAPLPCPLVEAVVRASFDALGGLHEFADDAGALGFVHGDLAPDHVLVTSSGQVGFVDLGQSRLRGVDLPSDGLERGTLPFVAPELARGEGPPGQEADVFALAATLVYAALGRDPVHSRGPAAQLVELADHGIDRRQLRRLAMGESARTALHAALSPRASERPSARAIARLAGVRVAG